MDNTKFFDKDKLIKNISEVIGPEKIKIDSTFKSKFFFRDPKNLEKFEYREGRVTENPIKLENTLGVINKDLVDKNLTYPARNNNKNFDDEKTINLENSSKEEINLEDISYRNLPEYSLSYTDKTIKYSDLSRHLNKKEQLANLGSLYIYPANPNTEGGISAKYTIPFEFNPNISESGIAAKYNATSILSRIGDIQSYIKTDSLNVTITTKYAVLSMNPEDVESAKNYNKIGNKGGVGSWMETFHLKTIQAIEMAYRSLVFPQTSNEQGYYFRPPLIKVVMNNDNTADGKKVTDDNIPFGNLLTYPYRMEKATKIYYRTFIATKVDIKKDMENSPLEISKDGYIIDTHNFEVSLSLTEVDPMYIGILPNFEDYISIYNGINIKG